MGSQIRPDIASAIRKAFPNDVMALSMDLQKSYMADVFPRLKKQLLRIDSASLLYERDPTGGPGWEAGDGRLPPDRRPPKRRDRPTSYYTFFFSPDDTAFRPGSGEGGEPFLAIGYCVALSVLAPLAMIVLTCMERDDVTESLPDIVPEDVEDPETGRSLDIEDYCDKYLSKDAKLILDALHRNLTTVLESFEIIVVPESELVKGVPWLKLPQLLGHQLQGRQLTVRDSFFFWGM